MRRAGDPAPAWLSRVAAIPGFIAQATRPDGRTEALGDSSPNLLAPPTRWAGTAAEWSSTNGAAGVAPSSTFASYAGGYVFGRSGWGSAIRPYSDETFYSVRAGTTSSIPHAHDDSGSLTLYSHGSELLYDTGQWEYLYGTTRQFIVSRAAHNVVLVNGVRRSDPRPALTTAQAPDLDMSTVVDTGYAGVTLTRTVAYDRADDVVLVWDRLAAPKDVTASQQWGLGRDRTVALQQDTAHTNGPGANVSLFFTAGGAPLDVKTGAKSPMRGWNSEAYGEIAPAPSLRATQRGSQLSWLTVIAPRADGVPGSAYSATSSVSSTAASVLLTTPTGSATVNLDGTTGSRTVPTAVTPAAYAAAPIVLAGSATKIRGTGLTPAAPVTLESLATGATDWTPVATGKASPSGTVVLPVTVPATADYRLVSGLAATAPVHVTAAVAPQPPTGVTATPSGRGQVTVTWTPPIDTGGAPLTQYAVRVDGKRVVVPAGATSAVVSGLLAGPAVATVRAFNAVAASAWAPVAAGRAGVPVGERAVDRAQGVHGAAHPRRAAAAPAGHAAGDRREVGQDGDPDGHAEAGYRQRGRVAHRARDGAGGRRQRRAAVRGAPHRRTGAEAPLTRRRCPPASVGGGTLAPVTRWVLHVDLDQFLAAVEMLRHPELVGRSVVVGGDGDPTKRGVVSTASYEARALGVGSGTPLRTALKRIPDAVFLPVDKEHYEAVSAEVMATLRTVTDEVEVLGWDEAFLGIEIPDARREGSEERADDERAPSSPTTPRRSPARWPAGCSRRPGCTARSASGATGCRPRSPPATASRPASSASPERAGSTCSASSRRPRCGGSAPRPPPS